LLLIVACEDALSLFSFFSVVFEAPSGGEDTSFGDELEFRDNHENGLERFLVVGAGGGRFFVVGGCGGAPHGIDGNTPESPWDFTTEAVETLGGRAGGALGVCTDDLDRGWSSPVASSKLISSRDIVDIR
jgi:hypothetical protein